VRVHISSFVCELVVLTATVVKLASDLAESRDDAAPGGPSDKELRYAGPRAAAWFDTHGCMRTACACMQELHRADRRVVLCHTADVHDDDVRCEEGSACRQAGRALCAPADLLRSHVHPPDDRGRRAAHSRRRMRLSGGHLPCPVRWQPTGIVWAVVDCYVWAPASALPGCNAVHALHAQRSMA